MFGNLFDCQPETSSSFGVAGAHVCSSEYPASFQAPVTSRPACGLCGLQNQGATCYLNTLIQTLLYTPEFRDALLRIPLCELQGSPSSEHTPNSGQNAQVKERVIPLQLQRLFARLLLLDASAVSTSDLTLSFGWKEQEELYQQQDVQELNRILFVALERSLVGTTGRDLVGNLHRGTILNQVQCLQCKNVSQSLEDFLDLTLIVSKDISSLEHSLCSTFLEHENMKGNNQYFCTQCGIPVDAQKSSKIKFLPPILTFSLLRFNYDFLKGCRYKETGEFSFPMDLDMGAFCCQTQGSAGTHYELFSVIIHRGSTFGGHYHAFIKDIDNLGNWTPPAVISNKKEASIEGNWDEQSNYKEKGKIEISSEKLKDPTLVLTAILANQPDSGIAIDSLCNEIINVTGSSWSKQYKKSCGPILKFIQKYNDVFLLSEDEKKVFLKKQSPIENDPPLLLRSSPTSDNMSTQNSGQWFDFNDSEVHPISAEEILKLFRGHESAYMLCYRSTSLVRPKEATKNSLYSVPEHLVSLVHEESTQLKQERQEYEKRLNMLELHILFGSFCRMEQGALREVEECQSLRLSVDQRSTLQQLRDLIIAQSEEFSLVKGFALHRVASVPAGLHLVECLPPNWSDRTLSELKISNREQLLVSWVDQISGVPVGPENVPLLLSFTCHLTSSGERNVDWAFHRTSTIGEVKAQLTSHLPSLKSGPHIFPSHPKGVESWKDGYPDELTLKTLGLVDGDQLLVFESCPGLYCVRIYNRASQGTENAQDVIFPSKLFSFHKSSSLSSLKAEAVSSLGLPSHKSCHFRLRKVEVKHKTAAQETSLCENQCLGEIFPKQLFCALVLEELHCPVSTQAATLEERNESVYPNITCHLPNGTERIISLSLPKNSTVAEVKFLVVSHLPSLKLPLLLFRSKPPSVPQWENLLLDETLVSSLAITDSDELHVWEGSIGTCWVQVYNRTDSVSPSLKDIMVQSKSFPADINLDLLSVKVEAILALGLELDFSDKLRFRQVQESSTAPKKPPLHETQRLSEVFPGCAVCPLVLEEGSPPAPNEITLFWSIGASKTVENSANFSLDSRVDECLKRICDLSGVADLVKNWHLRLGDWHGEPTPKVALCTELCTMDGLQHGDLLQLCEGPPSPSTFLALQVQLFPIPDCRSPPSIPSSVATNLKNQFKQVENMLKVQWGQSKEPFLSLGHVELSSNSTLLDLKRHILTLHPLNAVCVPTAKHLRLRLWQDKKMGTVLRGHAIQLSKLKLLNQQVLCAELLVQEEDLLTTDFLLNVCIWVSDKNHFTPPVNIVWSAGKKASSKSLLNCCATLFNMNPRKLALAKFCADTERWKLLAIGESCHTGFPEKISFRKGKVNLRQPPYCLAEGDTIALKECSSDTEKFDCFQATEDFIFPRTIRRSEQSRHDEVVEPSKEQHASMDSPVALGAVSKREVGISIHVDDFS